MLKTGSHSVAHPGLEFATVFLSELSECWITGVKHHTQLHSKWVMMRHVLPTTLLLPVVYR